MPHNHNTPFKLVTCTGEAVMNHSLIPMLGVLTLSLIVPGFQSSWDIHQTNLISSTYYPDTGHEYALIEEWLTWREARLYCERLGGYLATIGSASENDFVGNLSDPIDDAIWIGLTDETTEGYWEWVTGEPMTYQNWDTDEPNNLSNEDYTEMYPDGTWNDLPGDYSMYFVCEWDDFPAFPPGILRGGLFFLLIRISLFVLVLGLLIIFRGKKV